MGRDERAWFATAAGAAMWAALSGMGILPCSLAVLALACAVHRPTRRIVNDWLDGLFSYGFLRGSLTLLAGAMFIQILPLELALFAAADILSYVEIVAALGMIAANVRLKAADTALNRQLKLRKTRLVRAVHRAIRVRQKHRHRPSAHDEPDGWGAAIAAASAA